jgi:septal ring factor EnvC (AmiA/AmiB activator)
LQEAERARAADLRAQRDAASRAAAARADERRLAGVQAAALARLRETEAATGNAATRIAALAERARAAAARLVVRSADIAPLLPVLARLHSYPAETLLAIPLPPEQAVRGVIVLGGIVRQIEADARALRAEQAEIATLQAEIDAAMPRLAQALAAQAGAAEALDAQLRQTRETRRAAEDQAAEAAQRAAGEAARAENLRTAIAQLEAARKAAEERARREAQEAGRNKREGDATAARQRQAALARPAGPGLRGEAVAPVAGSIARPFGQASEAGAATGASLTAAPGARVVSPCAGRVMFAGPFRSFGQLLIIDCGGGYHFVLAGFDRLDTAVGQSVSAGAPVGVMPGWDPRASTARPLLYIELRHDGQPVDPAPYLRSKG